MIGKNVGYSCVKYTSVYHLNSLPRLPDEKKDSVSYVSLSELEKELDRRIELLLEEGRKNGYWITDRYSKYGQREVVLEVGYRYYMYLGSTLAEEFWSIYEKADLKTILQVAKEIMLIEAVCYSEARNTGYHYLYKKAKDPKHLVRLLREYRQKLLLDIL